jgi:hypothetical protein
MRDWIGSIPLPLHQADPSLQFVFIKFHFHRMQLDSQARVASFSNNPPI